MFIEEFTPIRNTYKTLFNEEERDEILNIIGHLKNLKTKYFSDELRNFPYQNWTDVAKVNCIRTLKITPTANFNFGVNKTVFSSSQLTLLGGFYCAPRYENEKLGNNKNTASVRVTIVRKKTEQDTNGEAVYSRDEVLCFGQNAKMFSPYVKIARPIYIKPNFIYEINIECKEGFSSTKFEYMKQVKLADNTTITFHDAIRCPISLGCRPSRPFRHLKSLIKSLVLYVFSYLNAIYSSQLK